MLLVGAVGWQASTAQEEEYILAHEDVFGKLRRPQVSFSHENHTISLDETGCGACHHTPGAKTGQLEYIEGDERSCKECHVLQKKGNTPALRPFTEAVPPVIAIKLNPAILKAGRPRVAAAIGKPD